MAFAQRRGGGQGRELGGRGGAPAGREEEEHEVGKAMQGMVLAGQWGWKEGVFDRLKDCKEWLFGCPRIGRNGFGFGQQLEGIGVVFNVFARNCQEKPPFLLGIAQKHPYLLGIGRISV